MYIETKEINGKKYYYLAKELRQGKRKIKFRTYLGKGDKSEKEISKLRPEKEKILLKKIDAYLNTKNPFFSLLSSEIKDKLAKVKKGYKDRLQRIYKRDDYYEWFITKFTYNSNAIEGSTLTEAETGHILFDQLVPEGRSLREIHEAENHKRAFDFLLEYPGDIDLDLMLKLNGFVLANINANAGKIREVQVYVRGASFMPPPAKVVSSGLRELIKWYDSNKKKYHPVILASYIHTEFEEIHPFVDGNGRAGRLLLNFILMKNGYPPIDIKNSLKAEYYESLDLAHKGDIRNFVDLVVKYLLETAEKE